MVIFPISLWPDLLHGNVEVQCLCKQENEPLFQEMRLVEASQSAAPTCLNHDITYFACLCMTSPRSSMQC